MEPVCNTDASEHISYDVIFSLALSGYLVLTFTPGFLIFFLLLLNIFFFCIIDSTAYNMYHYTPNYFKAK